MSLKKLNQFNTFNFEEFSIGKKYLLIGKQDWKEFSTNEIIGTKLEVVIAQDKTAYKLKEGEKISNIYEKLVFKVSKEVDIPLNSEIKAINPIAKVYGEYSNQLSIVVEDVEVVGK